MKQRTLKETELPEIPEDWEEQLFSEGISVNPKRELRKGVEAKFVSMKDLKEFEKKIQGFSIRKYNGGPKFINGDTLMARITPCLENGKTAYVDILKDVEVGFGSTEFIVLSAKKGKAIPQYVFYLAMSPEVRRIVIKSMTGTSGRQRAENDIFEQIFVCLPPTWEQESITRVLRSFDDKIELNQQMNKTLEEIGQNLFKHWFIDLEFPNEKGKPYKSSGGKMIDSGVGEIPQGWDVKPFSEVIGVSPRRQLTKGSVAKKVSMADLERWQSWITSWSREEYKGGSLFKNGDTLFARITPCLEQGKTAFVSFLDDKEVAFGSTEFIVLSPKVIKSPAFIFFLARSGNVRDEAIMNMTGTSGRQRVPNEFFDKYLIACPPDSLIDTFDKLVGPMLVMINSNALELASLGSIRDSLLPRLMSGQIRVPAG